MKKPLLVLARFSRAALVLSLCQLAPRLAVAADPVGAPPVSGRPSLSSQLGAVDDIRRDPIRDTIRSLRRAQVADQDASSPALARLRKDGRSLDVALVLLKELAQELRLDSPVEELRAKDVSEDELGMTHILFEQVYRSIPVHAGEIRVHLDRDLNLTSLEGSYIATPRTLNPTPTLSAQQASQIADTRASAMLIIFAPSETNEARLAYRVEVTEGIGAASTLFIDAASGAVLNKVSAIRTIR